MKVGDKLRNIHTGTIDVVERISNKINLNGAETTIYTLYGDQSYTEAQILEHWEPEGLVHDKIYAGLDADGIAKLFFVGANGQIRHILHRDWLLIADRLGLEPGEMPLVDLKKGRKNE